MLTTSWQLTKAGTEDELIHEDQDPAPKEPDEQQQALVAMDVSAAGGDHPLVVFRPKGDSRIRIDKGRINETEFNKKHWEYGRWFDDQGLYVEVSTFFRLGQQGRKQVCG